MNGFDACELLSRNLSTPRALLRMNRFAEGRAGVLAALRAIDIPLEAAAPMDDAALAQLPAHTLVIFGNSNGYGTFLRLVPEEALDAELAAALALVDDSPLSFDACSEDPPRYFAFAKSALAGSAMDPEDVTMEQEDAPAEFRLSSDIMNALFERWDTHRVTTHSQAARNGCELNTRIAAVRHLYREL